MELMVAFAHGFILALGLILPLGVQNVFIFNQGAYHKKFSRAIPAIMAASACDTLLILLAVGGVSVIVLKFYWLRVLLLSGGVAFLIVMGRIIWRTKPDQQNDEQTASDWPASRQALFAASVSLLNPHAIMDTVGVIGTSSLSYMAHAKGAFTFACIAVSWIWFFALAFAGRMIKNVDGTGKVFAVINKVSAIIMWGSALYLIYMLFG